MLTPTARVLIVDDEIAIVRLCQRLLERAGFDVIGTTESNIALDYLAREEFDLALVDIRLPDRSGFDLLPVIRENAPDISVVFMTGFGGTETAIEALRKGVDGLLIKPFKDAGELVDTVRHVLERRREKIDANRLRTLRPLFDLSEQMFSATSFNDLAAIILRYVKQLFQAEYSGIYRYGNHDDNWELLAGEWLSNHIPREIVLPGRELARLWDERPLLLTKGSKVPREYQEWFSKTGFGLILIVQTRTPDSTLFIYAARKAELPTPGSADLEWITVLARQAMVAIDNVRLNESLYQTIGQMDQTQKALIRAEKMSALGRLMVSFAHEINNPLQGIDNCLHLGMRDDLPTEMRVEYINLARNEVKRLAGLVQAALGFTKKSSLTREMVDLEKLIQDVILLVRNRLEASSITIFIPDWSEKWMICVYQDQIRQVILNLLLNSIDAVEQRNEPRFIWVDLEKTDQWVRIALEDNGPGVKPGWEERSFEPFASTKEEGVGLGLSVSYEIVVDHHHGDLHFVEPIHSEGARIIMQLPAQEGL